MAGVDVRGVLDMEWWANAWTQGDWAEALRVDEEVGCSDAIRRATYTGRPFADGEFTKSLERHTGRKLAPQAGGRPKKVNQDKMQVHSAREAGR